jgi:PhnB protein
LLIPHLHLNGSCREALAFYEKTFSTKTDSIQYVSDTEPEKGVVHAEIHIHGQRVMLNDRGGNKDFLTESAMQMVVIFDSVKELKDTYQLMNEGSVTIDPMQETFYSPCVVGFLDKFGIRWSFMV